VPPGRSTPSRRSPAPMARTSSAAWALAAALLLGAAPARASELGNLVGGLSKSNDQGKDLRAIAAILKSNGRVLHAEVTEQLADACGDASGVLKDCVQPANQMARQGCLQRIQAAGQALVQNGDRESGLSFTAFDSEVEDLQDARKKLRQTVL